MPKRERCSPQAAERPDGVTALLPLANAYRLAGDPAGEERTALITLFGAVGALAE